MADSTIQVELFKFKSPFSFQTEGLQLPPQPIPQSGIQGFSLLAPTKSPGLTVWSALAPLVRH